MSKELDKYLITGRIRRYVDKLARVVEGKAVPAAEVEDAIRRIENTVIQLQKEGRTSYLGATLVERITFLVEAFKHYIGIGSSHNAKITGMNELEGFLKKELGIQVK